MKIIVSGSRTFEHQATRERVFSDLDFHHSLKPITEVVHGACRGPDLFARDWAKARGIPDKPFPYEKALGRAGGPIRNEKMAKYASGGKLLAYWDGRSRGTKNMITNGFKHNMEVIVTYWSNYAEDEDGSEESQFHTKPSHWPNQ